MQDAGFLNVMLTKKDVPCCKSYLVVSYKERKRARPESEGAESYTSPRNLAQIGNDLTMRREQN